MKISIETIPHNKQRYDTCGDWVIDPDGAIRILVSETGDERYNFLVALHELIEVRLCQSAGITQQQVDEFDMAYEERRKKAITVDTSEPGDSRLAPYERQHNIASGVERILAAELGVKIEDYECELNSL